MKMYIMKENVNMIVNSGSNIILKTMFEFSKIYLEKDFLNILLGNIIVITIDDDMMI